MSCKNKPSRNSSKRLFLTGVLFTYFDVVFEEGFGPVEGLGFGVIVVVVVLGVFVMFDAGVVVIELAFASAIVDVTDEVVSGFLVVDGVSVGLEASDFSTLDFSTLE